MMNRLTKVSYPDNGWTKYCYTDGVPSACAGGNAGNAPFAVVVTKAITSSISEISTATLDGLARLSQTQLNSDPSGTTYTKTTYDLVGRKSQVYNPTRCSSITSNCSNETTWGVTAYTLYDALNRVKTVTEQDGSVVQTTYDQTNANSSGVCTTVTDEAGHQRQSCVDGLGRMTGVWEDPSGLNYETDYAYDALSNLLSVTQKGSSGGTPRVRTFTYDSLSRLACAANPEVQAVTCPTSVTSSFPAGAITYAYAADGNVITKTAPSPNQLPGGIKTVTTTHQYDTLNRLVGKSYSDGYTSNSPTPPASYAYDGNALTGCTIAPPGLTDSYPVGRRTSMCDGSGGTSWSHDTMGRILQERRTIGKAIGDYENDAFNLDGSVASVTSLGYGVTYTYSGAARPLTAMHSATNLVTGATYAPPGELAGMTLGSATGFAGITVANAYSDRLQPILLSAASPSATVFSECFDFHLGVAVTGPAPCSFSASAAGDNGNVYQIVNNRDNTRTQNFLYDPLNRIWQAYTNGSNWGETYSPTTYAPGTAFSAANAGIDAWGNLTNRSGVTGKTNYEPLSVSAGTNNQLSFGYDTAGNMTSNGSASYVYDDENRLIATAGDSYIYDGDAQRVEKCTEGTTPGTCATSATGTLYWKGSASAPLTETDLSGTNQKTTYIFFNGQRVARSDSAGLIHYYFSDHLGSHGVVENATGSVCEQDIDYYPYGGVENDYCPNVAQNYKFTGKERDTESGLDNFGARYNASSLGRFMTPDWSATPAAVPFANPGDPQSLNLYSYVVNNPLNRTDPLGHNWFCTSGSSSNCGHWEWHKGSEYTDKDGNKFTSKYTGLLTAQANGTDKKTGATLYKLTLYDQNKAVATGTGFSGGMGQPAIKDGNYLIRLDIRDPSGPNTINPNSPLNNPPKYWGIQKMHDFGGWDVVGAYGPIRARLNPLSGKPEDDAGDYFHGQTNGHGWTHGCLCYGTDTRFADYMWNNMPHAPLPAAIDVPTDQP